MKYKLSQKDIKQFGLVNIHDYAPECSLDGCVIHHWSKHHMRGMPLRWRYDRGLFERQCEHGVGHPDPDQARFLQRTGHEVENLHGCDGCCDPPTNRRPYV